MGGVDGFGTAEPGREPGKSSALCAMAVDDVGADPARKARRRQGGRQIARRGAARHRRAMEPQFADRGKIGQPPGLERTVVGAVAQDRDLYAPRDQPAGEIGDMAKKTAERRPETLDDAHKTSGKLRRCVRGP